MRKPALPSQEVVSELREHLETKLKNLNELLELKGFIDDDLILHFEYQRQIVEAERANFDRISQRTKALALAKAAQADGLAPVSKALEGGESAKERAENAKMFVTSLSAGEASAPPAANRSYFKFLCRSNPRDCTWRTFNKQEMRLSKTLRNVDTLEIEPFDLPGYENAITGANNNLTFYIFGQDTALHTLFNVSIAPGNYSGEGLARALTIAINSKINAENIASDKVSLSEETGLVSKINSATPKDLGVIEVQVRFFPHQQGFAFTGYRVREVGDREPDSFFGLGHIAARGRYGPDNSLLEVLGFDTEMLAAMQTRTSHVALRSINPPLNFGSGSSQCKLCPLKSMKFTLHSSNPAQLHGGLTHVILSILDFNEDYALPFCGTSRTFKAAAIIPYSPDPECKAVKTPRISIKLNKPVERLDKLVLQWSRPNLNPCRFGDVEMLMPIKLGSLVQDL